MELGAGKVNNFPLFLNMGILRGNLKLADEEITKRENFEISYNQKLSIKKIIKESDGEVAIDLSEVYKINTNRPTNSLAGAKFNQHLNFNWGGSNLTGIPFGPNNKLYLYDSDHASLYEYDDTLVTFDDFYARVAFQNNPGNVFTQDFSSSSGFDYDTSLVEFIGGKVQQKDQRPANSVIAAKFNSSFNANWGADSINLTATQNGIPTLLDGKLVCSGTQGIYYSDSKIGELSGDFVIKFKYTPNYTTGPATNVNLISLSQITGSTDQILLFHSPSGNNLRITANGLSAEVFDVWMPEAGNEYIFELICISNQISLYVNGIKIGSTKTISPGQGSTANRLWIGAYTNVYNTANGSFDEVIVYSTAPQTITYVIPDNTYSEALIVLPEMEYTGVGALVSFDSFTTTETALPRWTLEIGRSGNYLYWNGSAWVNSNNTYAQATSSSDLNTNGSSLPIIGQIYGKFRLYFPSSNDLHSIDLLEVSLTAQVYSTSNPTITTKTKMKVKDLYSLIPIVSSVGNIRFLIEWNDSAFYWNGSAWITSDGTYSQSNTYSDINNNLSLLDAEDEDEFRFIVFLNSDGSQATYVKQLMINYSAPALIESSKLKLGYNMPTYVELSAIDNADAAQIGTIKFKLTPKYTGSPDNSVYLFSILQKDYNQKNILELYHNNSGEIIMNAYDSDGNFIGGNFGSWSPALGIEYELCLCYDFTNGIHRLFIEGVIVGSLTGTGNRAQCVLLRIGSNYDRTGVSNFSISDFITFSDTQYTTEYTPGYTVPETIEEIEVDIKFLYLSSDKEITIKTGKGEEYTVQSMLLWAPGTNVQSVKRIGDEAEVYIQAYGERA